MDKHSFLEKTNKKIKRLAVGSRAGQQVNGKWEMLFLVYFILFIKLYFLLISSLYIVLVIFYVLKSYFLFFYIILWIQSVW